MGRALRHQERKDQGPSRPVPWAWGETDKKVIVTNAIRVPAGGFCAWPQSRAFDPPQTSLPTKPLAQVQGEAAVPPPAPGEEGTVRAALPVPLPPPWEPRRPQGPPRRRRPGGNPSAGGARAGRPRGAGAARGARPPRPGAGGPTCGEWEPGKGAARTGRPAARSSRPQPGEDRQFQGLAGAPTCEQEASEPSERQGAARPPQEGPGRRAREGGRAD